MLRFHLLFVLLFSATASQAMNETEKAFCKENPQKCSSYSPREETPKKSKEKKKPMASGPEWEVVEGENKNIITSYFIQLVRSTVFSNCTLQGGALVSTLNPNAIQDIDYFYVIAAARESVTLEQHKHSVTPLFRLAGPYDSIVPYDHVVPVGEKLPAHLEAQRYQYELFISTTTDRTRLQSIKHNQFYLRYSKVYAGDMTKPQAIESISKMIVKSHDCNAQ